MFITCSSANAKKWETEFQTLKNNNARLTAALQESAVNVEKWKEQLNNYKEDNQRLRKKVRFHPAGKIAMQRSVFWLYDIAYWMPMPKTHSSGVTF